MGSSIRTNEIIERINGYSVVAAFQLQADEGVREAVVVCDRQYDVPEGVDVYDVDRYAVWYVNTAFGDAYQGFYTDDREQALDVAMQRSGWSGVRGFRRPKA